MVQVFVDFAQRPTQEQVPEPLFVEDRLERVPGARGGIDEQQVDVFELHFEHCLVTNKSQPRAVRAGDS